MRFQLFTTILFAFLCFFSSAQTGSLDISFGTGGKVVTDLGGNELGLCAATQSDGKIIVGGSQNNGTGSDFLLIRYNSDGTLDKTFGKKGKIKTDFRNGADYGNAVVIQQDGKILLTGSTSDPLNNLDEDFATTRFNQDGSIDSTFGVKGKVITDFQHNKDDAAGIAVNADGKIIIAGTTTSTTDSKSAFAVTMYNADGSIDPAFGKNGKLIIKFGNNTATVSAIIIQPDAKIIIGGTLSGLVNSSDFALIRFDETGVLDNGFGANGKIISDFYGKDDYLRSIILQGSKIIAVGNTFNDAGNMDADFGLIRYNPDGSIDLNFGNQGKVKTDYNNDYNSATGAGILSNGEIVVSGSTNNGSEFSFLVAGYTNDGLPDNAFGTNGFTKTVFENAAAAAYGMAVQNDDKIIVAGHALGLNEDVAVARYLGTAVLPITLSSFTATKKQNSILLNWQTLSESNNAYFAVERSNDNNYFKEIARINSKGNTTQIQQYNFEDIAPLNGSNYYRLKQVNKDGSFTVSKIVLVDFGKSISIRLYPNPVKDFISIDRLTGEPTTISIIDVDGKIITTIKTSNTTYTWNIKTLPRGNYYLKVDTGKKITTIKFVKD